MEASDEAAVAPFPIGPSSTAGRLIAVCLLTSNSLKELLSIARASIRTSSRRFARLRRFVPSLRSPQVILACVIALALLTRRMATPRMVAAKVRIAYRRQFWKNIMSRACAYDEWAYAAQMSQKECGRQKDAALYDEALVRTKLQELQLRRKEGIVQDMLFSLRTDLVRNLGNMCNPELHMGRFQVPEVIQDYIDEVCYHLRAICDSDYEDLQIEDKLAFIRETRHAFGRTALLLSGGGSLGAFHAGVVRTLIEHGLLPRVVAGASVGSIVSSLIATRTWSDLQIFFGDNMPTLQLFDQLGGIFTIVSRLFTNGAVLEIRQLQRMLRDLTYNMTFQEAFDTTGRVLGISVSSPRKHEPPRCLNYLTSPHVVIWSAVTASCAFPGLYEAQELMAKDRHGQLVPYHSPVQIGSEDQRVGARHWRDGSLESDLPIAQLTELFNVNHFVVSQANPHVAPLLRLKDIIGTHGGVFAAKLAHLLEMEVKHRCNQVLEWGFPMGGVAKVFAQHWGGDVTIVMPATFAQFVKIIQNPTPMEQQKAVNQGRRCTWEKLSAIKANCGIELMLDECVSELNRRCTLKRSLERRATQASGATHQTFGAKRIPSWNVMTRENSWGSLDEEGIIDSAPHGGGPWAGPSIRRLKSSCNDGSDSESENMDFAHSWTRTGGPLMRTASATQFIQEQTGEPIFQLYKDDLRSQDSSDEADSCFPAVQAVPKEAGISKRGNKIVERKAPGCSATPHTTEETAVSCTGEQEHSASKSYEAMEANPTISQKNSGNSPCGSIFKMNKYLSDPEPDDEMGNAEASLREVLGGSITSDVESNQPCRKLTHVAFGSFIDKVSDPNVENDGC